MASKQSTLKSFFHPTGSLEPPSKTSRVEVDLEFEDELSSDSDSKIDEPLIPLITQTVKKKANESYYEDSVCRKECCLASRNEPYHLVNISSSTKKHGKQNHYGVQKSWFSDYKWLTYCTTKNSLYCFHCRKKNRNGGFAFSTKSKDAFVTKGFTNWKKGRQKFKKHEKAMPIKKYEVSVRPTVISMVSSAEQRDQETRRNKLQEQLESLRYLIRQGLPIRRYSNNDEGNLDQLLLLRKDDVLDLDAYLRTKKYLSPEIINEQWPIRFYDPCLMT